MSSLTTRLKHAYNAFVNKQRVEPGFDLGYASAFRPDASFYGYSADKSIVTTIYNQIAIDVASTAVRHCKVGVNDAYESEVQSGLNDCLKYLANADQDGRSFIQDAVLTLFDEGAIAVVPVDATLDPRVSNTFDVRSLRVGRIVQWYPQHVRVDLYNEKTGKREEVVVPKNTTAIVLNPLYEVMNRPNSTLQRLTRKLSILDVIDKNAYSGKLDIIVQLPYVVKTDAMKQRAETRLKSIEDQLANGKYGIAYADGTERITQLNRPAENNLLEQIKYLTTELYSRLGMTEDVFNGKATEAVWSMYWQRTVEPILSAITNAMTNAFLTKTARTQGHRVLYLRDPIRSMAPSVMVDALHTLLSDEVITSNEARALMGLPPASDPQADKLQNANINPLADTPTEDPTEGGEETSLADTPISLLSERVA